MGRTKLIFVSSLLGCIGCTHPESLSEQDKVAIVKEIQVMLEDYNNDIRDSGLTAEFKYLDHSSDFFWVPPGYSNSISYDSVASILRQSAPEFKRVDNAFETLHIVPVDKSLATYTGRLKSSITDLHEKTEVLFLVETGVLIKRSDGWKLLCGQTTVSGK